MSRSDRTILEGSWPRRGIAFENSIQAYFRIVLWSILFAVSSAAGHAAEFVIPTANSQPSAMAVGADGNLWFTEFLGNKIGRITPAGVITEFDLSGNVQPSGIAAGPCGDGAQCLWFTERLGNKIGRITLTGVITEFPLPLPSSLPGAIALGPDGNLWFTENAGRIGRITPSGAITEFTIPTALSAPMGITAGPDGNLWFTENQTNKIGRITPTGAFTEFPIATAGFPGGIAAGPCGDGTRCLWFTERIGNRINRMTTAGVITGFPVPTAGGFPDGITEGKDGNMWFAEAAGKIGRITPAGVITEFVVPTANSQPSGIASSADTTLWYTQNSTNKIGTVVPPVTPTTPLPPPPASQAVYTAPAGQLPPAAIEQVDTAGSTFEKATIKVTFNIANAFQSLTATTGFAAGESNVYVVALVPGSVFGSAAPFVFVKPKAPGNWGVLQFPIAAFLEGIVQNSANTRIVIEILSDTNMTSLLGTEFYIGYGTSDTEMLTAGRYRGVFKVQ